MDHASLVSPVALRAIDSFFVGGESRTLCGLPVQMRVLAQNAAPRPIDPNGDHMTGQMYVQAFRLASPRHHLPIVLWHGGGMTGVNWETTPDGRAGWLWRLLSAGFDVLVCDAVERGRSSWSMYPQIYPTEPIFRTRNEAWDMFRLGPREGYHTDPACRVAFAGQQFDLASFDRFSCQWVPRWAGQETLISDAYDALLEKIGPCIVIAHSQGGGFAMLAAQRRPEAIRAVVAIEPSGAPSFKRLPQHPPHLVVWGDYIAEHPVWSRYRQTVDQYCASLAEAGARAQVLDLPAQGVRGNSHFLMMDRNSDVIADRILDWLQRTTHAV